LGKLYAMRENLVHQVLPFKVATAYCALRPHEAGLRALSIELLAVLDSTATDTENSDVRVAVRLSPGLGPETARLRVCELLGRPVDVVEGSGSHCRTEP
jgi:hypothetical protein